MQTFTINIKDWKSGVTFDVSVKAKNYAQAFAIVQKFYGTALDD